MVDFNRWRLKLKDGSTVKGKMIKNDMLCEMVWKVKDRFVFECDVDEHHILTPRLNLDWLREKILNTKRKVLF